MATQLAPGGAAATAAEVAASKKQTPSDFLKQIIGRPVVVKLNSGLSDAKSATKIFLERFQESTRIRRPVLVLNVRASRGGKHARDQISHAEK